MKTVFSSSSDVMHLFAEQSQFEGKTQSRNVFFEGKQIWSYGRHYLLGQFIENKKGQKAILINNDGYSVTTSKHIRELRMATRQYKQFLTMQTDVKNVLRQIETNVQKLVTARKKELYILPSQSLFESINEFIEWTGKKDLKKLVEYKKILKLMAVINGGDHQEYIIKERARIKREQNKRLKEQRKQLQKQVEKFEAFEIPRIYGANEDFLRISKDLEDVETSQGVKIPIKAAKLLYSMIIAGKDIKGYQIEQYTVISINGVLKIGCHNINIESMHKVGKQL